MKSINYLLITVCIIATISGCATQKTLYQNWGEQLNNAPLKSMRIEDVSLMLGAEPYKCEDTSSSPMIGVTIKNEKNTLVIDKINPNGAAATSGLKSGDEILSINSKITNNREEVLNAIKATTPNNSVTITTQRGSFIVLPKYATETKQCYWEITAGEVTRSTGVAQVNGFNGNAIHAGSKSQRFFRASCRFTDGVASQCHANWQE
jgi:predicted metalloprotease with PDZ domain